MRSLRAAMPAALALGAVLVLGGGEVVSEQSGEAVVSRPSDGISRPIGEVALEPSRVSRPIGEVALSPSAVSRPVGEVAQPSSAESRPIGGAARKP